MLQRTLIAVMVLGLLLVACTTNKDSNDNTASEPPASETDTAADADTDSDTGVVAATAIDADSDDAENANTDDPAGSAADLFGSVNPLQLLGSLGDPSLSQDVNPDLKQRLLVESDLPEGFTSAGEFGFSTPTEFGEIDMVANMFTRGDLFGEEFGAMVMSTAMLLPPEALEELGDLSELQEQIAADSEAFKAEAGEFADFAQIELLDASGLGDGGLGMRLTMDFGGLAAGFGVPEDELDATGIAMDMYVFFQGEQMLMVVTMWPTDEPLDVDAYELAQRMADK